MENESNEIKKECDVCGAKVKNLVQHKKSKRCKEKSVIDFDKLYDKVSGGESLNINDLINNVSMNIKKISKA